MSCTRIIFIIFGNSLLIGPSLSLSHFSYVESINDIIIHDQPNGCSIQLVESIPEGLVYNDTWQQNLSTFKASNYFLILAQVKQI